MYLLSKSFLVRRGDNLGDITEFLKSRIGLDAFLIRDIQAESVNSESTRLTILYQQSPDVIVSNILPKKAGLYTTQVAGSSFHSKILFSEKVDFGTLISGSILVDGAAVPASALSGISDSNYYGVSVDLSSHTASGFHYIQIDRDVLKTKDGRKFDYSPIEGYVVHGLPTPNPGDELPSYSRRIRGEVTVDVVRANKSTNVQKLISETLSVKNIDPSSLLAFAQTRLDDNLLEIYYIYVGKPEPIIIDGFPLNNSFFPDSSPPDKISFVFNSQLDTSAIQTRSLFDVFSGFSAKRAIDPADISVLSDNRTIIIDSSTYISSPGAYTIVARSGIADVFGNKKYKPEFWNVYVDTYAAGSSSTSFTGNLSGITGVQPFGGLNLNGNSVGIVLGPGFTLPTLPGSGISINPGSGLTPPGAAGAPFHVRLDSNTLTFDPGTGIQVAVSGLSGQHIKAGQVVKSFNNLFDNVLLSYVSGITGSTSGNTIILSVERLFYTGLTGHIGKTYVDYATFTGYTGTVTGGGGTTSGASTALSFITWQSEASLSNEKTLVGSSGIYVDLSSSQVTVSTTFYSAFTGHTGSTTADSHTLYVTTKPSTSARNQITSQLDVTALTLSPYVDQTVHLFTSKDTAGAVTVWIDSTGFIGTSKTPTQAQHIVNKSYVDTATGTLRGLGYITWQAESLLTSERTLNGLSGIYVSLGSNPVTIAATFYADFTGHTGNLSNPHSVTAAQIGATTLAQFTGHTGDTTIHFTQSQISITASQVSNFDSTFNALLAYLSGSYTGHTGQVGDLSRYVYRDGTRGFTGTVSGITPTLAAHLATKGYVDSIISPVGLENVVQYNTAASSGNYALSGESGIYLSDRTTGVLYIGTSGVLFTDGTRPLVANWDAGRFQATNLGTVMVQTGQPSSPAVGQLWYDTTASYVANVVEQTTVTGNYTATYTDTIIFCSGTFTVTLPSPAGVGGKVYWIKNIYSSNITVTGLIEADSSVVLSGHESVTLSSDNFNWWII